MFLRAPSAPIYTNFEGGGGAPIKRNFLVNIFQKVPKNAFLACFFKILPHKIGQKRDKTELWESSKKQFGRPKKKGRKNFQPPPTRKS